MNSASFRSLGAAALCTAFFSAFGLRAADTLPEGYTRLEYVKTTGTQYFDTGFYPCPGTKMDASILIEMTNRGGNANIYGAGEQNNYFMFSANLIGSDQFEVRMFLSNSTWGSGLTPYLGTRMRMLVDSESGYVTLGGASAVNCGTAERTYTERTLYFPGHNSDTLYVASAFDLSIYSWKILVSNELVRSYLPCRREEDKAIGLYDTVNDFFDTARSEDGFVPGEDWSGDDPASRVAHHVNIPGENAACPTYFKPLLSSFSANIWIRNAKYGKRNNANIGVLMSQAPVGVGYGFNCHFTAGGSGVLLHYRTGGPEHYQTVDMTEESTDDKWHMVTTTYDRMTRVKRFYIDGKMRVEDVCDVSDPINNDGMISFGAQGGTGEGFPIEGDFAQASFWDRALTPDEVRAMRHAPLTGTESGLIGYWPFETDTQDNVANGNLPHPCVLAGSAKLVEGGVTWPRGMILMVR